MAKWRQFIAGGVAIAALAIGLHSLVFRGPALNNRDADPADTYPEPGLTLRDVTLEQPDEQGQLLWRVKGEEVTYSSDQQVAFITRPDGDLFQDGEVIYVVTADTGEVRENGSVILLRGNIVATGVKNGSILRGNEMEWRPQEDVLIMREQITGTHPQLRATANEARVFNRENRMELEGDVVANTVVADPKTDPWIKLQAQELTWFWAEERIDSAQPLRVEQFKQDTITDVVTGQRGSVDLADQLVTLREQVAMQMLEMPLNMTSEALDWQVDQEKVTVNQPLTLIHPENRVRVTARQGRMNLAEQQIYLSDEVVAVGEQNQSRLTSDRMNWNVATQTIVAEGQVNYRQVNPIVNLNGSRVTGRLDDQTIVVDGGRVVTEIVPN
ncbi:LPS export ABC transporter periplasmic protein LptC [Nodosilinea sp. LEGE 07088]|uniref:LPS export ABC transporter periplasmic protein LptC n=1 Tax=Nodosilinea sp. LEGE 07088 TaxID=2777968 RepID=UPI00188006E8|nr:LPS export ABC transporter periplasmic protein LptC [Nodosilinea sp. LEGE 07088]MBE9141269.1 LPS export ABC transporter periplasmic protein LptC [Nodosilinea sp. LEGE 07088]